jgi:hypothetical protein
MIQIRQNPSDDRGVIFLHRTNLPDPSISLIFHFKERGDIYPPKASESFHKCGPGFMVFLRGHDFPADFQDRVFPVSEDKGIEEIGEGLRVQSAGPAPDD